jgi:hypothetical protein
MMRIVQRIKARLVLKFPYLRGFLLTKRERQKFDMVEIRAMFVLFGHDLSGYSDEQIQKSMRKVASCFQQFGCSAEAAAQALKTKI